MSAHDRYRVSYDGDFRVKKARTTPPKDAPGEEECKARLAKAIEQLDELQHLLFAHDHHSVLLVFQAMDAAGKDSTIRAVLSGVNPAGCEVYSFKSPSHEDLEHDFLWRTARCLPKRGRIGVFNRSHYEEVLVVRVHPEFLDAQHLPNRPKKLHKLWKQRYEAIREHERHVARSGTLILKFWLNVSKKEQRTRFLARLEEPEKNWKFSANDVAEREHWGKYMEAYEDALNETSRPWAPWYAIPADDKPYLRMCVAEILVAALKGLDLRYPQPDAASRKEYGRIRRYLEKSR